MGRHSPQASSPKQRFQSGTLAAYGLLRMMKLSLTFSFLVVCSRIIINFQEHQHLFNRATSIACSARSIPCTSWSSLLATAFQNCLGNHPHHPNYYMSNPTNSTTASANPDNFLDWQNRILRDWMPPCFGWGMWSRRRRWLRGLCRLSLVATSLRN